MSELPTKVLFSFGHPARDVMRRVLLAELVRAVVVEVAVVVVGVASDGWHALGESILLGAAMAAFVMMLGLVRAWYWLHRYGAVRYDFCEHELVLAQKGTVGRRWPRTEIYSITVESGGIDTYGVLTNTAEMPRLIVRTITTGREEGPRVLFWGRPRGPGLDLRIRDWITRPPTLTPQQK